MVRMCDSFRRRMPTVAGTDVLETAIQSPGHDSRTHQRSDLLQNKNLHICPFKAQPEPPDFCELLLREKKKKKRQRATHMHILLEHKGPHTQNNNGDTGKDGGSR